MSKNIKKVIKEYVRQCLKEILAEQFIENMVKQTISENFVRETNKKPNEKMSAYKKAVLNNSIDEQEDLEERYARRREILKKVNPEGPSQYASVFEDTLKNGNPILDEIGDDDYDPERQELVSENQLKQRGLLREDYSKFVK
jgi:hypothetical protein